VWPSAHARAHRPHIDVTERRVRGIDGEQEDLVCVCHISKPVCARTYTFTRQLTCGTRRWRAIDRDTFRVCRSFGRSTSRR
jgi:hypothetical protein